MDTADKRTGTGTRTWQPLPPMLPHPPDSHSLASKTTWHPLLCHHAGLIPMEKFGTNHPSRTGSPRGRGRHDFLGTKLAQRWSPRPKKPAIEGVQLLQPAILRLRVQHASNASRRTTSCLYSSALRNSRCLAASFINLRLRSMARRSSSGVIALYMVSTSDSAAKEAFSSM